MQSLRGVFQLHVVAVFEVSLQLGGTQIMYRNGVSHMTANDDFAGVSRIVEWMSFAGEAQRPRARQP